MSFDRTETAVVFIDPQVDVLSKNGKNWGAVGASVTENKTVENMLRIFKAAKSAKFSVFISPHYFFPPIAYGNSMDRWRPMSSLPARLRAVVS